MANSYVLYTAVAPATTNLNVPFSYLDVDQVNVYIDDVLQTKVTHWDFTNPTTIALVTPTSGGEDILIQRETEIDSAAVTFSNAMLVDTDLNTSHLQNFYLHQEVVEGLALGDYPILSTAITSGAATDGQVLTADGAGNAAWEDIVTILNGLTNPFTENVAAGGFKLTGLGTVGTDTALAPALTFGDGDTGFYESADDDVFLSIGGTASWQFSSAGIESTITAGPALWWQTASYLNPVISARTNDSDTGIGSGAADSMSVIAGGLEVARATETAAAGQFLIDPVVSGGGATFPSLGFGDGDTGFYENTDDDLRVSVAGVARARFYNNNFESTVSDSFTIRYAAGTSALPTYAFRGDENTGMYRTGTDSIGFSCGGAGQARLNAGSLDLYEGCDLRLYSLGNTNFFDLITGTTDAFIDNGLSEDLEFSGWTDIRMPLIGSGSLVVDNGTTTFSTPEIELLGDAPSVMFHDDGAAVDNRLWIWGYGSETMRLRMYNDALSVSQDAMIVARTATSVDYVRLYADTDDVFQTQFHDATGNTSGAQVVDHGNTYLDVGFNTLQMENWNAAATLAAQHCGKMWGKDNTTARTLTGPASSNLDFPIGGMMNIANFGSSGNLTLNDTATCTIYLVDGSTVTDVAGSMTIGPGGIATLWRNAAGSIYVWGSETTV